MKRLRKAPDEGPDHDAVIPTFREIAGFLCPAGCGLIGYGIGIHFSGFMAAFLCAMVGVGLGTRVTRRWSQDFYL
jgi:hypothetical protein